MTINQIIRLIINIIIIITLFFCIYIDKKEKGKFSKLSLFILLISFSITFMTTFVESFYNNDLYLRLSDLLLTILFSYHIFRLVSNSMSLDSYFNTVKKALKESNYSVFLRLSDKGNIKDISDSLLDIFGLPRNEVIGHNIKNIINETVKINEHDGYDTSNEFFFTTLKNTNSNKNAKYQNTLLLKVDNHSGHNLTLELVETNIFKRGKYDGILFIGSKAIDERLYQLESDVKKIETSLLELRDKYNYTIEISDENLYYRMISNNSYWFSDNALSLNNLPNQLIDINEFEKLVHKDDLPFYKEAILNAKEGTIFNIDYRFLIDEEYVWFSDRLIRDSESYIGVTNYYNDDLFELTNDVNDIHNLDKDLQNYMVSTNDYLVIQFDLNSLQSIKEEDSKSTYNIIRNKFIEKISSTYVTNLEDVYSYNEDKIVLLIKDNLHIEQLTSNLTKSDTFMNLEVHINGLKYYVEPLVTIIKSSDTLTISYVETLDSLLKYQILKQKQIVFFEELED